MLRNLMELLGLVEDIDESEEEVLEDHLEKRKQRFFSVPAGKASVVICRQQNCSIFRDSLASSLHHGQVVIADLRKMEKEEGQGILDFLTGVAYAVHGSVSRLCPGVFIIAPRKTLVEEWIEDSVVSEKEHFNKDTGEAGIDEGNHYGA